MIILRFITSIVVITQLYSNIVWALPSSLQPNSAFDDDPSNSSVQVEMVGEYNRRIEAKGISINAALGELDEFLKGSSSVPEPEFVGFGWEKRPGREFLQGKLGEILGLATDGRIVAHRLPDGRLVFRDTTHSKAPKGSEPFNERDKKDHPDTIRHTRERNKARLQKAKDFFLAHSNVRAELEAHLKKGRIRRLIIEHRIMNLDKTLEELGEMAGVTKERIRQIEKWILDFVDESIKAGQCVTADTILPVVRSGLRGIPIVDVRPGDYVLSLNEETQQIEPHRIKGLLDMGIKPVYKLTTVSGRTTKTTANHPYLTRHGWVKVSGLSAGDNIAVPNVHGNGAAYGRDTGQSPRQSRERLQMLITLVEQLEPYFQSLSSFLLGGGQLINPTIPDNSATKKIAAFTNRLNSWKKPLTQPAIAVNLNISKNVLEIMSRRFLWKMGILLNKVYYGMGFVSRYFYPNAEAAEIGGDIIWERIVYIEYIGYEHVYDIEVEGTHNFIGNGIFAHNTYIGGKGEKGHRFRRDVRAVLRVEYFKGALEMAGNDKSFLAGIHDRRLPKLEELQFTGQGVMLNKDTITNLVDSYKMEGIGKMEIGSISKMLFKGEDDGSDSFCELLRKSFINLMIKLMRDDKLASIFFSQILGSEANQGKNICIRIAKDMPVNSRRYYDKDNDLVVIVLDSRFVEVLPEYFEKSESSLAIKWMLAERVFIHELSHDNEVNSLGEEMEEEARVIESMDLVFFREFCYKDKHLMMEITQFRSKDGVSEATKSGEYFRFLTKMCLLMKAAGFPKQYIKARIRQYVLKNISFITRLETGQISSYEEKFEDLPTEYFSILEWIKIIGKGLEGLTNSEIRYRVKNIREMTAEEGAGSLIIAEALALFKEAARRILNITIYDEQILGAIAISEGKAVEMLTGEGKTLTIAMAGFLQSLFGKGVHIATFNDYLAKRDMLWMGEIFNLLGITVGLRLDRDGSYIYSKNRVKERVNLRRVPKKQVYCADIVYGSSNLFVFDFEEDSVVLDLREKAQGELNSAIVDEGDSILVDEALIPLTLSIKMKQGLRKSIYYDMAGFVKNLVEGADYRVDIKNRLVIPDKDVLYNFNKYKDLRKGYSKVPDVVFENCLMQALRAKELVHLDEDYIIEDGRLVIIDEFTGRPRYGYVWGEGLHQAVEAKEGLMDITDFSKNLNSMTKFGYFRMYKKLSCASGTLRGVRDVLSRLYGLETVEIPPNKPVVREEYPELHFTTKLEKFTAVVNAAKEMRESGRPVLIGTRTIKDSELLSRLLFSRNIPHRVLNGKRENLKKEAEIISEAGMAPEEKGNVTVVTNLAGRGTDIILGAGVNERGGLHIIGTEHHESIRVDNQLRGRAGRQGDRGSCRFFSSKEDYIIRRFRDKGDPSKLLEVILKESWKAAKDNLLFRAQLDSIYSSYQDSFFELRNRLLDSGSLTQEDIIGLLEEIVDLAEYYKAAKKILDEVLIVEDAIFSQILKGRRLVRSAHLGDKERSLEMLDLRYEVFIFRMQTLMERLRTDGLTEEGILRLFRKASRWIFDKFVEELYEDIIDEPAETAGDITVDVQEETMTSA